MKTIIPLVLALVLIGCGSSPKAAGTGPAGWWKPGITDPQEIVQAMAKCRVTAAQSASGTWRPRNVFAAAALDADRREDITHDCLIAEGYRYTRQSMVPPGLAFVPAED
jgi:hypothetical protein